LIQQAEETVGIASLESAKLYCC